MIVRNVKKVADANATLFAIIAAEASLVKVIVSPRRLSIHCSAAPVSAAVRQIRRGLPAGSGQWPPGHADI